MKDQLNKQLQRLVTSKFEAPSIIGFYQALSKKRVSSHRELVAMGDLSMDIGRR